MEMLDRITKLVKEKDATLVAVSKTQSVEKIKVVYNQGQRVFGENKVQEILEKKDLLPEDIQWHMIGHLQRNKVKSIAPFIAMIHSVDSEKLLAEIQKQAQKNQRVIDILLQVFVAQEETKFGLNPTNLMLLVGEIANASYPNIRCRGLMGMATHTEDESQIRLEFRALKKLFEQVKKEYGQLLLAFNILSMGMSGDYEIALEEGSNMIRIGSLIFGNRVYL